VALFDFFEVVRSHNTAMPSREKELINAKIVSVLEDRRQKIIHRETRFWVRALPLPQNPLLPTAWQVSREHNPLDRLNRLSGVPSFLRSPFAAGYPVDTTVELQICDIVRSS